MSPNEHTESARHGAESGPVCCLKELFGAVQGGTFFCKRKLTAVHATSVEEKSVICKIAQLYLGLDQMKTNNV